MSKNAIPSVDPANYDSLLGMLRHCFNKFMQGIDGVIPAQVVAYNRDLRRASVRPLIPLVATNGDQIPRAQIASVPVVEFGGGGFVISTNLLPGDKGVIMACDRDISLYLQSLEEARPNSFRIKDFADSFFIPTVLLNYILDSEDANNLVLQSNDGTVKISLGAAKIKIAAPDVEIAAANTVTINCENTVINATTGATIVTPTLHVSGNITASGDITAHVPP
jgi:hypothetical protein